MHTVYLVGAGLFLLLLFFLVARMLKSRLGHFLPVFLVVWFIAAAVNMWVGVSQANYTIMQEIPFLLVVFGVPALVAILLAWRF